MTTNECNEIQHLFDTGFKIDDQKHLYDESKIYQLIEATIDLINKKKYGFPIYNDGSVEGGFVIDIFKVPYTCRLRQYYDKKNVHHVELVLLRIGKWCPGYRGYGNECGNDAEWDVWKRPWCNIIGSLLNKANESL
jgi:hypothetical protein